MSNYKGIQDRSAKRVAKLDDLKIFNYREEMEITPANSFRGERNTSHLIQEGPPGRNRDEDVTCGHTSAHVETLHTSPSRAPAGGSAV